MTISDYLTKPRRTEAEARSQLSIVRNKICPACGEDAPMSAWFKAHRWTVECENKACDQQPSVSANGRDEAWRLWNNLSLEDPELEAASGRDQVIQPAPRGSSGAWEKKMASHPARKTNGKEIYVVVTTSHRGVFGGYAIETNSKTIVLRQARNCISWPSSVGGFVGLATSGPNSQTKIGPAADMTLHDVTAVLKCTPEAEKAWANANWKF